MSLTQLRCMPVDPDLAIQSPGVESVLPYHVKSFDHPPMSLRPYFMLSYTSVNMKQIFDNTRQMLGNGP